MVTSETDTTRRILDLLAQGKITVDEADQLLRAVSGSKGKPPSESRNDPQADRSNARWMRITIDKAPRDGRPAKQVTIRVPMALVRGGARLGAIFPYRGNDRVSQHLRDHGIDVDWSRMDWSKVDTVLQNMDETTIDVDNGKAQVRISYE